MIQRYGNGIKTLDTVTVIMLYQICQEGNNASHDNVIMLFIPAFFPLFQDGSQNDNFAILFLQLSSIKLKSSYFYN